MSIQQVIEKFWGLEISSLEKLEGGFRNLCLRANTNKDVFLLIVYKSEEKTKRTIEKAHRIAKVLSTKNFPTRIPIATQDGKEFVRGKLEDGYHYIALYPFLEGETIPWEAYTRRHLKSMGKTLSDMHHALREILNSRSQIQISEIPKWRDITKGEIVEMKKYLSKVEPWIEKKLGVRLKWNVINKVLRDCLQLTANSLQRNVLHYDFVRGNILFSKKLYEKLDVYPITGILDFEKVCLGPEIADIARTLAFLIIDCKFKEEKVVRKRFLISGYERRGENKLPFEGINHPYLETLLKFFWLRDFWKFLVYNPYEDLHMNEHYVRTCDRLVKAGLAKV